MARWQQAICQVGGQHPGFFVTRAARRAGIHIRQTATRTGYHVADVRRVTRNEYPFVRNVQSPVMDNRVDRDRLEGDPLLGAPSELSPGSCLPARWSAAAGPRTCGDVDPRPVPVPSRDRRTWTAACRG